LSELTKAWLLYLGLTFMLMVMFAPGGIASLIMMNLRVASYGKLKPMLSKYLVLFISGLVMLLGIAAMVEMVYHLQLNQALGSELTFLGIKMDAKTVSSWSASLIVFLAGLSVFEYTRRNFAVQWGQAQEYIENEIKRKESL
jgi:branched-chain amino acid transport system permease protein